jgi:hypothetical protein
MLFRLALSWRHIKFTMILDKETPSLQFPHFLTGLELIFKHIFDLRILKTSRTELGEVYRRM